MKIRQKETLPKEFQISSPDYKPTGKLHIHTQLEMVLICCDGVVCRHEEGMIPVEKGSLLLFSDLHLHGLYAEKEGCYPRYVLYFSPSFLLGLSGLSVSFLECFYDHSLTPPILLKLSDPEYEEYQQYFHELMVLKEQQKDPYTLPRLQLLLGNLILRTRGLEVRCFEDCQIHPPAFSEIDEILSYIHSNIHQPIRLSDLSHRYFISSTRLHALFREATGLSPGEYIVQTRIQHAKSLLLQGDSVQHTCVACGYENEAHFCRTFKKHTGLSPGQFRKKYL